MTRLYAAFDEVYRLAIFGHILYWLAFFSPTNNVKWFFGLKFCDTLIVFPEGIFEKVIFEKSQQRTTKAWKITQQAKSWYAL